MVQPTTLKRRHSLKNCKLLPVIKRIKQGKSESLKEYARVNRDLNTEGLTMEEVAKWVKDITGEDVAELLDLAARDINVEEARWALHCVIVHANEVGQPKGQDLQQTSGVEEVAGPSGTGTWSSGSTFASGNATAKRKREDDDGDENIEDRIKTLEKAAKVEMVQELRDKVRSLCMQQEPSSPLILLTLEDLARTARKVSHEEAETFEELARQANRHQGKIDISLLCLKVLGGKAADAISKAMSKCMKDKDSKSESKGSDSDGHKRNDSPLANLYPPYQNHMNMMYPMFPGAYPGIPSFGAMGGGYSTAGYRRPGPYRLNFRPRGACLFCESTSHQVKDCEKMRAARGK